MKIFLSFLFCLIIPLPLQAWNNKTLQLLLHQSAPHLRAKILNAGKCLPDDLFPVQTDFLFILSKKRTGALAQYNAETGQTLFFQKPLLDWLRQARTDFSEDDLPRIFARCAAPLYIHEAVHARHARYAQTHHFFWPVTLEDEYIASFWQLEFILSKQLEQPDYYRSCAPFMPPAAWLEAPPTARETLIYERYAKHPGKNLPPPPMRPAQLHQALESEKGEVHFAGKIFRPRHRRLTLNQLFTRNSDWTHLRPGQLSLLPQDTRYRAYRRAMNAYLKQTLVKNNLK